MVKVLGIDPSLTSLGYAYLAEDGVEVGTVKSRELRGMDRVDFILAHIRGILDGNDISLVAYEGYAMGKFAGRMFDRAELGGVLKYELYLRKIQVLLVPPRSLKLFATGDGAADKPKMMKELAKEYGRLFRTDDEADAYGLYLMALGQIDRKTLPRDRRHHRHVAYKGCMILETAT